MSSRHIHFINYKDEGEFINWPTDSISGGRQVGNRQQEGRCHFLDFKSSQRCYSILNAALGSRTVYAKLQLGAFNLLSILYGLLARNFIAITCSLSKYSVKFHTVSGKSTALPIALKPLYWKEECKAQRST